MSNIEMANEIRPPFADLFDRCRAPALLEPTWEWTDIPSSFEILSGDGFAFQSPFVLRARISEQLTEIPLPQNVRVIFFNFPLFGRSDGAIFRINSIGPPELVLKAPEPITCALDLGVAIICAGSRFWAGRIKEKRCVELPTTSHEFSKIIGIYHLSNYVVTVSDAVRVYRLDNLFAGPEKEIWLPEPACLSAPRDDGFLITGKTSLYFVANGDVRDSFEFDTNILALCRHGALLAASNAMESHVFVGIEVQNRVTHVGVVLIEYDYRITCPIMSAGASGCGKGIKERTQQSVESLMSVNEFPRRLMETKRLFDINTLDDAYPRFHPRTMEAIAMQQDPYLAATVREAMLKAGDGDSDAELFIAHCYCYGWLLDRNLSKAAKWFFQAAKAGHYDAIPLFRTICLKLADADVDITQIASSIASYFSLKARRGNAVAQCALGECYFFAVGVENDDALAFKCFFAAAEEGHAGAIHSCAECYALGRGVEKNLFEAIEHCQIAAIMGNSSAKMSLILMHSENKLSKEGSDVVVALQREAADLGDAQAQYLIGMRYFSGNEVEEDREQALCWLERAADEANVEAIAQLAYIYKSMPDASAERRRSTLLSQQASKAGHSHSTYLLGLRYLRGDDVSLCTSKAIYFLQKAADAGYSSAQHQLGVCYTQGRGVPQDIEKGKKLVQTAKLRRLHDIFEFPFPETLTETDFEEYLGQLLLKFAEEYEQILELLED